ncbi:hypothetical protein PSI19_05515 [Xenorhabdus khoisanae]|uniref:hypothetical protein n=1 Tax=Xenorhabdus khoisanae TaxID=880157 RepID=UPI0023595658|nr:hypothetical protein [Xenorhabdus khoisanae]MDC9613353.1 hypothetical protein [Xenorhabdus khoisanae]
MKDISQLYSKHPELYDAFSTQREFLAECRSLLDLSFPSDPHEITTLELLAGPARHSLVFNQLGCKAYSLDGSEGMKAYSVAKGIQREENYFVSSLPSDEPIIPPDLKFNIFTLLRYSVGYFTKESIQWLLKWCQRHSHKNGILFIQVHKPSTFTDIIEKHEETRVISDTELGKVENYWPLTPPTWSDTAWEAIMTVKVIINGETHLYESREIIHSYEDIKHLAELMGCRAEIIPPQKLSGFTTSAHIVAIYL